MVSQSTVFGEALATWRPSIPDSCSSPLFDGGTCISAMTACHGMAEGEVPEVREKNEKGKGSLCPHQHPYSKVFSIGVGNQPNYSYLLK